MQHEIIISNSNSLLRVSADDVMVFCAEGNYTKIVLNDGYEQIVTSQLGLLSEMVSEQLGADAKLFIRVGRSLTINRECIYRINLADKKLTLRSHMGKRVEKSVTREALMKLKMIMEQEKEKGGSQDADRQNE